MEEQNRNSVCEQLLSSKYPLLVGQNPEATKDDDHIIYTMHKPLSYFKCKIPELHGRRIRGCFHGWVVLSNHPYNIVWSLWNPFTSKLISLPPMTKTLADSHECCLSSPPDDPCSVLFFTTRKKPTIIFCRPHCKRKKLRWIERSYAKQFRDMLNGKDGFLANPTCCNGKVYALQIPLGDYNRVVEVDIVVKNNKVLISLSPFVIQPDCCVNRCPFYREITLQSYLKGSCTDLFYIEIHFDDVTRKTVSVVYFFKLDMTSKNWEEIEDLEDATIYIELASHEDSVFYQRGIASELGGYIHILDEMGKVTYSYNVKRKTISLSSMPYLVLKSELPAWAMLECRLEGEPSDSKHQEEEKENPILIRPVTCDLLEFDRFTNESHLLNIPIHICEIIMELCVGVEYMNFRATCKRCNLAAPSLQWSNRTLLRRLQTYSLVSPWLMVFDKNLGIITFTDPLSGDKYFKRTPQELIGFKIYCSRYGWLLMYKVNGPLVFFNPFTNEIRELPMVGYLENFCFSAPPTSSNCMVVGFITKGELHLRIHFIAGEPSWFRLGGDDDPSFFRFPTFCGQDIYVLCNDSGFDVYRKVGHNDYSWESVIAEVPRSCTSPAERFLATCDQHLFLVLVCEFGESVEVFKVNESTKEWEKIDCLGKHMIYISTTTCLCIEAKLPEMENKIYFPRLHSANEKVVFYSLETCKYHTFNGKALGESFMDFFGSECHSNLHTWIEPSWS